MAVKVLYDGEKLVLSETQRPQRLYPTLDRLCAKLKTRGFRIERTGAAELRYAWPVNPKHAHPRDTFTRGVPVYWN